MKTSIRAMIVFGVAAAGFATPAVAGTQSAPLTVSANVTANCTVSAAPLAFGNIDTLNATPAVGTASLSVTCTNGSGWTAAADAGTGNSATLAVRRMTAGANTLNYVLYTDSNRTTVWGDGSAGTSTIGGTGTGSTQSVTIYGRIPAGQTGVPAGSYQDTVSVTVTY